MPVRIVLGAADAGADRAVDRAARSGATVALIPARRPAVRRRGPAHRRAGEAPRRLAGRGVSAAVAAHRARTSGTRSRCSGTAVEPGRHRLRQHRRRTSSSRSTHGWLNLGLWEGDGCDAGEAPVAVRRLVREVAAPLPRGGDVLDVGNGLGAQDPVIAEVAPPRSLTALNITLSQLRRRSRAARGGRRASAVNGDAYADAVPRRRSFDGVISVEAAFHFPSRAAFFAEALRVLAARRRAHDERHPDAADARAARARRSRRSPSSGSGGCARARRPRRTRSRGAAAAAGFDGRADRARRRPRDRAGAPVRARPARRPATAAGARRPPARGCSSRRSSCCGSAGCSTTCCSRARRP